MTLAPEAIGAIGVIALLVALAIGVPIGVALGLVALAGLAVMISPEAALIKAGVVTFATVSRYELGVLPLFVLMAHLCFAAGASRDFFDMAARCVGHRRGGLAMASIAGCAGFGAISGSSLATVATVTSVALPEMRKAGYAPAFATGALAAGGTLGSLVPPSGALIIFGIVAEQAQHGKAGHLVAGVAGHEGGRVGIEQIGLDVLPGPAAIKARSVEPGHRVGVARRGRLDMKAERRHPAAHHHAGSTPGTRATRNFCCGLASASRM